MKFLIFVLASFFAFTLASPTREFNGRIAGGQEVFPNEHKFAVALRIQGGRRPLCGGSIISTTFILTAGSW
jgi:secreted trypsin-like serine protease